jgi:hypothetical protein
VGATVSAVFFLACASLATPQQAAPPRAGTLEVSFLYMPPSSGIEPTYHTAMWIEDARGKLVKTLYVSQELSAGEYRMGEACPDWVRQAHWEKAPRADVDAVTAPTPSVGSETKTFDLGKLGVPPGVYQFKFQVHISEQHNVLHRGALTVGPEAQTVKLETVVGPGKMSVTDQFVRDVDVRYKAPAR